MREPWRLLARCREEDTAIFFDYDPLLEARAKAICALCPVRRDCLEYALETPQRDGIWGGLTERERRSLARQRRITGKKVQVG